MDQTTGTLPTSRYPVLQYDGRLGQLYRIFLVNLLLSIITLGIYRFWAITRWRRYFWSHMRFQNERFEYTGRGGELFLGFLMAIGILLGLGLVAGLLAAWPSRLQCGRGQRALESLVEKLRTAGGIPGKVHIEVLDDPMVNAMTLPGRRVLVMRGLIDNAQDGGELAGVIAHELGHVAHRDPTTLLLRQMGIGLIAASLGWNDTIADTGGIAQQLLTLSYSRQAEAAADATGEAFLTGAGLRADGLGRFFAQLETIQGHDGGVPWLATHPPTPQRLAHATRSTAGAPPLSDAEWQAVRGMCR